MARKKIEPIETLGRDTDKLTVQKSLPLFSLWRSDLTLPEFKILDIYLSRINSHKPEKRVVVFEKGELEKALGVKKIDTPILKKRLHNLMMPIDIEDENKKKGFTAITLFEEAVAEQDEYEQWKVKMTCTNSAMKYVFNIENLGYLRYKLRCITELTSRYTYIMFLYLEHNRYRKTWEVSVNDLKQILACDKEDTYKEFKRFNDLILKKIHKEMHEKTECKYTYEPIKRGRSVAAVRFTVETLPKEIDNDYDPNQITLDQYLETQHNRDNICFGFGSSEFDGFTDDELVLLKDLAWAKKDNARVEQYNADVNDMKMACEYATADYLRAKILMAKTKKPNNPFLYIKKMIENE